jgi:hypothetical protein
MLKMAQQLALAEADLQQQQQTLDHHQQQQHQRQDAPSVQQHQQQLAAAADMLVPPALGVLRLIRQQDGAFAGPAQNEYRSFMQQYFEGLHGVALEQFHGTWKMLSTSTALVSSCSRLDSLCIVLSLLLIMYIVDKLTINFVYQH